MCIEHPLWDGSCSRNTVTKVTKNADLQVPPLMGPLVYQGGRTDSKEIEISCVKTINEALYWLLAAVMLGEKYVLGRGKS